MLKKKNGETVSVACKARIERLRAKDELQGPHTVLTGGEAANRLPGEKHHSKTRQGPLDLAEMVFEGTAFRKKAITLLQGRSKEMQAKPSPCWGGGRPARD